MAADYTPLFSWRRPGPGSAGAGSGAAAAPAGVVGRTRLRLLALALVGVLSVCTLWTLLPAAAGLSARWRAALRAGANRPPRFVLIGDSTTASQAEGGGGWGPGFEATLVRGADAANYAISGATTKGFLQSDGWRRAVADIEAHAPATQAIYATIQFGHNDQNPVVNISLDEYQAHLVYMARAVRHAGATPILVTPLATRDFDADGAIIDRLAPSREATLRAYAELVRTDDVAQPLPHGRGRLINLSAASVAYLGQLGKAAAYRYNKPHPWGDDTTHLNEHGSVVFGRMVADLVLGHPPRLVPAGEEDPWTPGGSGGGGDGGHDGDDNDDDGLSAWIAPDPYYSGLIWHGDPA